MALRLLALVSLAASALAAPAASAPDAKVCPAAKKFIKGYNNVALPNPFLFNDGSAVTTRAEWDCRREQIKTNLLAYELGDLPGKPPRFSHTFTRPANLSLPANLTMTSGKGSKTMSFSVSIKYPAEGVGSAPYPAVIVYDGASIPIPSNVAVITYAVSQMGVQNSASSRGQGLFYNLYGADATGSAMIAWTWGLSRIIDALEATPKANIATGKLAVTGCSRNGKGALVGGAFEERIALTIPQESGSGGNTCWRLSKFEQDSGDVVQQATEIVGENVWFSEEFANWVYNISELPYDHHMLAGLVAPRALFSTANTDYEWLSPLSSYGCMSATQTIYQALGVPSAHTFNEDGNHLHCLFPTDQYAQLNAFYDKYLFDEAATNTSYGLISNFLFNGTVWNPSQWINWPTPTLN